MPTILSQIIVAVVAMASFGAPPGDLATSLEAKADAMFAKRATAGMAAKAITNYEEAIAANPDRVEPFIKLAHASIWAAHDATTDAEKLTFLGEGMEMAKLAVDMNPSSGEAYMMLGLLTAMYGQVKGVLYGIKLLPHIKESFAKAAELSPSYLEGGPDRMLGIIEFQVPSMVGGDKELGLSYLEKAYALAPKSRLNCRFLGEAYLETGNKAKAKELLDKVLTLPANDPPLFPVSLKLTEQAKELLAEIGE